MSIIERFNEVYKDNQTIKKLLAKSRITYKDANAYAIEIGNILGDIIATEDNFPDGIGYDGALAVLSAPLNNNYKLARDMAKKAQQTVNREAGLQLNAVTPKAKADLVPGIAKEISTRGTITGFEKKLADQVAHFTLAAVDDTVSVNAYSQTMLGLSPKIVRESEPNCCEWCSDMEGTYTPDEAEALGVYRRHDNCRCTVEYQLGDVSTMVHSGKEGARRYVRDESGRYNRVRGK